MFVLAFVVIAITVVFSSNFTEPFKAENQFLIGLIVAIEIICILHYSLIRLLQCALFFTFCTIIATLTYSGHVRELYKIVKIKVLKNRQQLTFSTIFINLQKLLEDHNKVCYLVVAGSNELFGAVLFSFLVTNVPINIFCIRQLVFFKTNFTEKYLISFTMAMQFFALAAVMGPPAWCSVLYHSIARQIPKLQVLMNGRPWLLLKLKYDDFLNRMLYGCKIAIFMGPAGPITYSSALEVIIVIFLIFKIILFYF